MDEQPNCNEDCDLDDVDDKCKVDGMDEDDGSPNHVDDDFHKQGNGNAVEDSYADDDRHHMDNVEMTMVMMLRMVTTIARLWSILKLNELNN